jgi:hypothetical protein
MADCEQRTVRSEEGVRGETRGWNGTAVRSTLGAGLRAPQTLPLGALELAQHVYKHVQVEVLRAIQTVVSNRPYCSGE